MDFSTALLSMDQETQVTIYLANNIWIVSKLSSLKFFDDYLIYDGRSGTMYFPDQEKIFPKHYTSLNNQVEHLNLIPYSAICLISRNEI